MSSPPAGAEEQEPAPKRAKLEDRKFEFIKRGGPYRAVGVDTERCLERVLGPVEDGDYPGSWKRLEEAKDRAPEADRVTVRDFLTEMQATCIFERMKCDEARKVLEDTSLRQEFFDIYVEDLQKIYGRILDEEKNRSFPSERFTVLNGEAGGNQGVERK